MLSLLVGAAILANPLSGEALYADVERYAAFGIHQTGSEGDIATAEWLAGELAAAGYEVERQPFEFVRFEVERCALRLGESELDSYPFWFPHETSPNGVVGQIVPYDEKSDMRGKIGFVSAEQAGRRPYYTSVNPWAETASGHGAVGMIVEVPSASGEVAAINAVEPYVEHPLPIPCVVIGTSSRFAIDQAIADQHTARIIIEGKRFEAARATNVVARIKRGPKWLVVTTPASGWFSCAGERGPGVALFLGLARYLGERDTSYSLLFMANSGHELGTLGAHRSLNDVAPPPGDVVCWIHLGASIATRAWKMGEKGPVALDEPNTDGNLVATEDLLGRVKNAFAGVPWLAPRASGPVAGELKHFIDAGYSAFGFFGPHYFFHTRRDTPETTSPELLEPVGQGLAAFVDSL